MGWDNDIPTFDADPKGIATRESSGKVLNAIAARVPWMIGGAADLAPSTKTNLKFEGAGSFEHDNYGGRNLHFGIREHGMGAVVNGLALSNLRPFGSTFLIFSDYMKPPIRLSAIMEVRGDLRLHARSRSASAKTGRRISRSSNWPRCAACPA